MTMSHARTAALSALLCMLGCGHTPEPGESVAEVCRVESRGQQVRVSGYLVPPVVTFGCNESCSLLLSDRRSERDDAIRLRLPVGTGPRTMNRIEEMGPNAVRGEVRRLRESDFVLRDDRSGELSVGDVVRVRGELHVRDLEDGRIDCSLEPTHIEAL